MNVLLAARITIRFFHTTPCLASGLGVHQIQPLLNSKTCRAQKLGRRSGERRDLLIGFVEVGRPSGRAADGEAAVEPKERYAAYRERLKAAKARESRRGPHGTDQL